jgi:[ribosomal protein S5]-alanine N-acetyltransferase
LQRLETERTWLRVLLPDDASFMYALNLDPEVMRYTGDMPYISVEAARGFLQGYDQYMKYGVGRYAVIEKSSNSMIGWCGLKYHPECNEYDLGYRFLRNYWNKGFATETSLRFLKHGFMELATPAIVGRAMKENIASIHVLEKIGMRYVKEYNFNGAPGVEYMITKDNYLQKLLLKA